MNIRFGRILLSVAVLGAASLPVVGNASDNTKALDQCVQAFVKEVVPAGHPLQIRHEDLLASTRILSDTRSRVNVVARGSGSSKVFGRATCVMDRSGGSLVAVYFHGPRLRVASNGRPKARIDNG